MNIIKAIQKEAKRAGSQKALADELGVSDTYLSDVINGRKEPGDAILVPLGWERIVTYRRAKGIVEPEALR